MKFLKALFIFVIGISAFLIASNVHAYDKQITLAWQPNTEPNMAGYYLYVRKDAEQYDYSVPSGQYPCVVSTEDGKCYTSDMFDDVECSGVLTLQADDDVTTVFSIVARAYSTEYEITKSDKDISGDSNEVSYTINREVLPVVSALAGSYDKDTKFVNLSWTQEPGGRALYWEVFMSKDSGGPYDKLLKVDNSGQTDVTAKVPITDVALNIKETRYFVIVGFAAFDIYSDKSPEVGVEIYNPVKPADVMNLRIPVQ